MYERTEYGDHTIMMADRKMAAEDEATERDDAAMVAARGGRHSFREGACFNGWCDVCGVARAVHL